MYPFKKLVYIIRFGLDDKMLLYFRPMEMSDLINDKNDRGMSECHNR